MASCPRCRQKVPIQSILQATGLAGVVCPGCHASLWPTKRRNLLLLLLSWIAGLIVLGGAHRLGFAFPIDLISLIAAMIVVYLLLTPVVLRLEVKESSVTSLKT